MSLSVTQTDPQDVAVPHQFLDGLLSRENVRDGLCEHFFEGNYELFDKYWMTLKEQELREFFSVHFGKTVKKSERPYTFVVYGASGYTGSLILEYIYTHVKGLGTDITFALAGRTTSKLQARLAEVLAKFPDATYKPNIFKADISNNMDIRDIVQKCRCVLNVAGPFMTTNAHLLVGTSVVYS